MGWDARLRIEGEKGKRHKAHVCIAWNNACPCGLDWESMAFWSFRGRTIYTHIDKKKMIRFYSLSSYPI
jgi:hypothetical protein